MPTLTRFFIKAGLIHFAAALCLGVGLQWPEVIELPASMTPVYFHLFMYGWITQIIMGVSVWMFPPLSRDNPRGHAATGWSIFACLNVGLLLRALSEPIVASDVASPWRILLVVSALLQWAAGILYVGLIWNRVRGK